jgi:hypothetical protein
MATIEENRSVQDFSEVELSGYGEILLEQTDGPESLVIEADEAILRRIKSEVRGRRLILSYDVPWWDWLYWINWTFFPNKSVRFHLAMREINEISTSGAASVSCQRLQSERLRIRTSGTGKIRLDAIDCNTLETSVSGSGNLQIDDIQAATVETGFSGSGDAVLSGTAQRHTVHIGGAGRLRAAGLETQETRVTISGSGNVLVNAGQSLEVNISGSGTVRYLGDPEISQRITGAGLVARAERAHAD